MHNKINFLHIAQGVNIEDILNIELPFTYYIAWKNLQITVVMMKVINLFLHAD